MTFLRLGRNLHQIAQWFHCHSQSFFSLSCHRLTAREAVPNSMGQAEASWMTVVSIRSLIPVPVRCASSPHVPERNLIFKEPTKET